jgi:N-acyl-D-aspartate/D-glutamate deacylase
MKKKFIVLLSFFSLANAGFSQTAVATYDAIIKNGRIVDGTGNPWFRADIGIIKDRIAKIGFIPEEAGKTLIEAEGRFVTPGFIDIHSHVEGRILEDRSVHNMVRQGCTTIVGGNCGGSPLDFKAFYSDLLSGGFAVNIGMLAGHNTIRHNVMGNEGREPTDTEMEKMKELVETAMKEGALGLSTGLKYRPGTYSKTGEVIALATVAAKYHGFYATHLRDEGLKLFEAMEEAIEIGRKAGIPVQMSHHKVVGADMWGKTTRSLQMMEEAREGGIDVTTDLHPYPATYTGCTILFPAWALEGDRTTILERLKDPEIRKKVISEIVYNIIHDRGGNDLQNVTVSDYQYDSSLEGKNLKEILEIQHRKPTMEEGAELLIQIYENGGASCVFHCLMPEDVVRILKHPLSMYASDAGIAVFGQGKPHPRHYGHYPRILARHVRDRGDLRIEEAIRKMTSLPASRIGEKNRGILTEGKYADIVIFDLNTIQDKATFEDPHQYPEGIDYVFINGEIVVDHDVLTGKLPGKIIYGPGK